MDILRAQATSSNNDRALAGSHRKTTKLRGTLNFDFRVLEDSDDTILPVENTYDSDDEAHVMTPADTAIDVLDYDGVDDAATFDEFYSVEATPLASPLIQSTSAWQDSLTTNVSLSNRDFLPSIRSNTEEVVVSDNNTLRSPIREEYDSTSINEASLVRPDSKHDFSSLPTNGLHGDESDLLNQIPGMYRLLDLILEQGSGGLVDKIVIPQHSLGQLINALRLGAYTSMTKIDFKALDLMSIKPVGVYGSRPEIVKLLVSAGAINERGADLLLRSNNDQSGSKNADLRSGLYFVVRPVTALVNHEIKAFIVYWPETTTWEDGTTSSVAKNRATFMRYMSKLVDQTIAVISPEQSKSFNWKAQDSSLDAGDDELDDDHGRMFAFQVAQTRDETESVISRDGFKVFLTDVTPSNDSTLPASLADHKLGASVMAGETACGFITSTYVSAKVRKEYLNEAMYAMRLTAFITDRTSSIHLPSSLDEETLSFLLDNGLRQRFPAICGQFERRRRELKEAQRRAATEERRKVHEGLGAYEEDCLSAITVALQREVLHTYPVIPLAIAESPTRAHDALVADWLVKNMQAITASHLKLSKSRQVEKLKYRSVLARNILAEAHLGKKDEMRIIRDILDYGGDAPVLREREIQLSWWKSALGWQTDQVGVAKAKAQAMSDTTFLEWLSGEEQSIPTLAVVRDDIARIMEELIGKAAKDAARSLASSRLDDTLAPITSRHRKDLSRFQTRFIEDVQAELASDLTSSTVFHLESMEMQKHSYAQSMRVCGWRVIQETPRIQYKVFPFSLTQADEQSLRLDANYIPIPRVQGHYAQVFSLPLNQKLRHIQRIGSNLYLVAVDCEDYCSFYVEDLVNLNRAITRDQTKKKIYFSKLSKDFVMAFDEGRQLLALCGATPSHEAQLQVQIFVFDEQFTLLSARGSPIQLLRWYEGMPNLRSLLFIAGTEELCLIERSGRARVFSLITEQFRPASLQLDPAAASHFSTPDGSCLLAVTTGDETSTLAAYHWSSFGSNQDGIRILLSSMPRHASFGVTSLGPRSAVHLLDLSESSRSIHSVVLQIQRKSSEFQFKQLGHGVAENDQSETTNNCLLDCHLDVWTRFPVQAAIQRENISFSRRCRRSLTFLTDAHTAPFAAYYDKLVGSLQSRVHKPSGAWLSDIEVSATLDVHSVCEDMAVSLYSAGEWVVELLCLIPLHLAVTRQNRFIPLKDGIWSPEYERELLGADVGQIVDSLSLGWYESLFQSYMVSKPVRVVSSMGEQSVGKSYALNHFVDTSFAGSAMRTTEGVWMSVTPTHGALVVALDFEGVHSIERSPQEDALLVLFNTAISNLVLFRNNFALSRDIAGLFTSFQSSSSILDPASNPGIFNGTLCIIIRDVVDSDAREIVNEFSLKFQKIVEDEKEENFISRLHRGRINIVPWPVINSPRFYSLFGQLKKQLEQQHVSHSSAGVFLHTLKTLMAKLKANDWGALDQNLASHRTRVLTSMFPIALSRGLSTLEPDCESLKDIDSDTPIKSHDSGVLFFVPDLSVDQESNWQSREASLQSLIDECQEHIPDRFSSPETDWINALKHRLSELLEARIQHVRDWIIANTTRFRDNNDIQLLYRAADVAYLDVSASAQVCGIECADCSLLCIRPKNHPLDHACGTSHRCWRQCEIVEEHSAPKDCGLPAGHAGRHMCEISAHSCGKPCSLEGKRGCMHSCNLPIDHLQSMHMCSARTHLCGRPCALQNAPTASGSLYTCRGLCTMPWDVPHEDHACEKVQSCPIVCELCGRSCSAPNHFHGLESGVTHLCGQNHTCPHLCELPGICYIETQPSEIVADFNGVHESFQFTKYTQVSRRLACTIPILPGSTSHTGVHKHNADEKLFHFCEERCSQCEYFCTLPIGHSQNLHETRHGSMTAAKWVVDSPDDSVELDGHRFGSGDDGAPMLCNMVCTSQGRHAHIDFCRSAAGETCRDTEVQHITAARMHPSPDREKDWISHRLHWARLGFKDPFSHEEQAEFAKCDSMCGGSEHATTGSQSFCTKEIFHAPLSLNTAPDSALGYVSHDGHSFNCANPVVLRQSFHVIFVIDSSWSMTQPDRRPLPNTPSYQLISQKANNRYGAVLSALYGFWSARQAVVQSANGARRDAYSVVTFSTSSRTRVVNDFSSTPDQLLDLILTQEECSYTNFEAALKDAQKTMQSSFSPERAPVLVFLSDGEAQVSDATVYDICRKAVTLGKPLSFHAVSFGQDQSSYSLRRMVQIAQEVYKDAPQDQMSSTKAIPCSYTDALDTIQLAETFLGIADSLTKTRASLIRG